MNLHTQSDCSHGRRPGLLHMLGVKERQRKRRRLVPRSPRYVGQEFTIRADHWGKQTSTDPSKEQPIKSYHRQ